MYVCISYMSVSQSMYVCTYVRTCVVYKTTSSKLMKSGVSTVSSYVAVALSLSKRTSTVQYLCVLCFFNTSKQFSYVQYGSITVVLTSTYLKRSFHIIPSFSSDRCSATGFSTHFLYIVRTLAICKTVAHITPYILIDHFN